MEHPQPKNDLFSKLNVKQLSEDIYLSNGFPLTSATHTSDPRLIIIFGWMDAPAAFVFSKFGVRHREMYPNSNIAVICSRTGFMWTAEKQREATLRPLAEYLLQTVYAPSENPLQGVLLHVISNGGAMNLLILSEVLHRMIASSKTTVPELHTSLILDSTPGNGEWTSAYNTFLTMLGMNKTGNPIAKGAVAAAASVVWAGYTIKNKTEGLEGLFTRLHQRLLKEDILPSATAAPHPRLYIYSTADTMVPYASVDDHLVQLIRERSIAYEEAGRNVWVRKMDDAPHLGGERFLKGNEKEPGYWDLVRSVWEVSVSTPKPRL